MLQKRTKKVLESSLDEKIKFLREEARTGFSSEDVRRALIKAEIRAAREAQAKGAVARAQTLRSVQATPSPPSLCELYTSSSTTRAGGAVQKRKEIGKGTTDQEGGVYSRTTSLPLRGGRYGTDYGNMCITKREDNADGNTRPLAVLESDWLTSMENETSPSVDNQGKDRKRQKSVAFALVSTTPYKEEESDKAEMSAPVPPVHQEEMEERILQQIHTFTTTVLPVLDTTAKEFMMAEGEMIQDENHSGAPPPLTRKTRYPVISEEEWWRRRSQGTWSEREEDYTAEVNAEDKQEWVFPPRRIELQGSTANLSDTGRDTPLLFFIEESEKPEQCDSPSLQTSQTVPKENEEVKRARSILDPSSLSSSSFSRGRAGHPSFQRGMVVASPSLLSRPSPSFATPVGRPGGRVADYSILSTPMMVKSGSRVEKSAVGPIMRSLQQSSSSHSSKIAPAGEEEGYRQQEGQNEDVDNEQRATGPQSNRNTRLSHASSSTSIGTALRGGVEKERSVSIISRGDTSVTPRSRSTARAVRMRDDALLWLSCPSCHTSTSLSVHEVLTRNQGGAATHTASSMTEPAPQQEGKGVPVEKDTSLFQWDILCPHCGVVFTVDPVVREYYESIIRQMWKTTVESTRRSEEGVAGTIAQGVSSSSHRSVSIGVGDSATKETAISRTPPPASSSAVRGGLPLSILQESNAMRMKHGKTTLEEQGIQTTVPTSSRDDRSTSLHFPESVSHAVKGAYFLYLWDLWESSEE